MRTVRKRHRDAMKALRFSRSALKLTFVFGVIVFMMMAVRIVIIEFPETGIGYAGLVRDVIIVTSALYTFFLVASVTVVAVIYYLFKKNSVSIRMFRIKDLLILLTIQIVLLSATAYISYSITAR